ncbi:tol-pal system YbgF family protein [Rickettsiales endosymbiont of Stachyamoeba lipophora]|uniref:hypothetical protein n=1 Tax=Rickettsiales endosymbiont of Stachyamoeba lipophora TaxID=2486578 RepID=UPI000F65339C|nr:hypothetical protein [Rickettsiales endosymbiont of Stachyamoeba lipophora]AZL15445.1 hypothetical protein EF513_02610 [Rickettsiales endosymbiont of Stachyamoeba lipophora]
MYYKLIKFLVIITISISNVCFAASYDANLNSRLLKLERDLDIVRKQSYKGTTANITKNLNTDAAEVESRLLSVEEQLRYLNGKLEENEFLIRQNQEKLDLLNNDFEQRFKQLEENTASSNKTHASLDSDTASDMEEIASDTSKPKAVKKPADNTVKKPTRQDVADLAKGKPLNQQLKEIEQKKQNSSQAPEDTQQAEAEAAKSSEEEKQAMYNQALQLIKKNQLIEAGQTLDSFIKKYGNDPLVGYAYYWYGETFFSQKLFEKAAIQYLKGFKYFPKGKKAPETLYKASIALGRIKKNKEGCNYIRKMYTLFPDLNANLKAKADREYTRMGCDNL